jgi:hypothetical protein
MVGSAIDSSEFSSYDAYRRVSFVVHLQLVISLTITTHHTATYEDLVHYFKYASSAYILLCPRPNGKTLVSNVRRGLDLAIPTTNFH